MQYKHGSGKFWGLSTDNVQIKEPLARSGLAVSFPVTPTIITRRADDNQVWVISLETQLRRYFLGVK